MKQPSSDSNGHPCLAAFFRMAREMAEEARRLEQEAEGQEVQSRD